MSLGSIPNDIRVPLCYIEIDNSDAVSGTPAKPSKILVLGQQLAGGSATPLTLNRITSDSQPGSLYGKGSMLAGMLASLRKANSYDLGVGYFRSVAGAAASAEISVTGTASEAGTLYLLVAGEQVQVGVTATMTAAALTAAIIVAINATLTLPVTAVLKEGTTTTVVLTAKHKAPPVMI